MSLPASYIKGIRLGLGLALILFTYLMLMPVDFAIIEKTNDKIDHILAFYLLALLADFSFADRGFDHYKITPLMAYALLMESIQHYLPHRTFSVFDLVADGAGLLIYRISIPKLRHVPLLRRRWNVAHPGTGES